MKPIKFANWWLVGTAVLALGVPAAPVPGQSAASAPPQDSSAPSRYPRLPSHP